MDLRKLSLDADSRRALEFDALLELVAGHARSALGRDAVRRLEPLADGDALAQETELLADALRHLEREGALLDGRLPEIDARLPVLDVGGALLGAGELRDVALVLRAAGEAGALLRRLGNADDYPALAALGATLPDLRAEAAVIEGGVDGQGRLLDHASPELARLRREQARGVERLTRLLTKRIRGPQAETVIRDDFITRRNGRYVIPVRTDAPRPVEGIVHARSSSGATRFVEPLETVELNNDLVRLDEQEREETQRILLRWTDALRSRAAEVRQAIDGLGRLDGLQARARYGRAYDAIPARVAAGADWEARALRHPLLERHLRERGERSTPVDLAIDPADQVVVLSGPNAGGKTVTLKALGLAVLAAQAAIPVPAGSLRLPLYGMLRADVGDHQSIDADLSTFSAHLQAVVRFLAELRPPALVLFDEIGSGTEPSEGAALARAVLEELRRPGVTTLATTHHGALKSWGYTTEGVSSAAMEFDMQRLAPTFRILPDAAGVSAGLEIAQRMGLAPAIVRRARGHLGAGGDKAEDYLDRLRELATAAERERDAARQRAEDEARERAEQRSADEAEQRRTIAQMQRSLDGELKAFRAEVRRLLQGIEDGAQRERARARTQRAEHRLASIARGARARTDAAAAAGSDTPLAAEALLPGRRVHASTLGRDGTIKTVRGERVEVDFGRLSFTVPADTLRSPVAAGDEPAASRRSPARAADDGGERELLLVGQRVQEALEQLDRALDGAVLAGLHELRIIHGHGSGRLRSAVRDFLRRHRQVASFRAGSEHEGGDGATVALLR